VNPEALGPLDDVDMYGRVYFSPNCVPLLLAIFTLVQYNYDIIKIRSRRMSTRTSATAMPG
jgi:hypothetical protein